MYIPMMNCVSVITQKKATIRFLPRVSAYKLFKKWVIVFTSPPQERLTALLASLAQGEYPSRTTRVE